MLSSIYSHYISYGKQKISIIGLDNYTLAITILIILTSCSTIAMVPGKGERGLEAVVSPIITDGSIQRRISNLAESIATE